MTRRALVLGPMLAALTGSAGAWAQAPIDSAPTSALQSPQSRAAQDRARSDLADQQDGKGGCFYINQLQNNRVLNDRSVIFRVNVSDYYRLDFAQRCYELTYPEPKLILTPVGGIGSICRALDLDVRVGEQGPGSFPVSCIPSVLHRMTPAEVAAVPKKDLP